ncbi:carbon storage regulator [Tautonia sociabilis]|uniref:Translational regulator CsrA n=1 Tax=Tautonia sociabilis TaxID=2080755 RepID=A0A432ML01_9BACT|nr:carbon storage regulator [Tautonia sociabilis]RUL88103.1 carbon storage regulator [Tautonia sociabilis]
MLVLSRKLGQRFQIGEEIRVTIIRIDRNAVRIGVEAPDGRAIYREELLQDGGLPAPGEDSPISQSA